MALRKKRRTKTPATGTNELPAQAQTALHSAINSQTVLELTDPTDASAREFGRSGVLTLFATGIVNPFGPTLNVIAVDGDPEPGRELPVLRLMLNPFVQEIEQVGIARIASSWSLDSQLASFFPSIAGSCPSILMPSAMLDEGEALELCSGFLQLFDDGVELLEKVRRFPGDPWNRVKGDVDGLGDVLRQFEAGEELTGAKQRLTREEARELASSLLDEENLKQELAALFQAWRGSIEFYPATLAAEALPLDDFVAFFALIAPSCRMPDLGN